jgi:hypothetical protein
MGEIFQATVVVEAAEGVQILETDTISPELLLNIISWP